MFFLFLIGALWAAAVAVVLALVEGVLVAVDLLVALVLYIARKIHER
jgi:hypothetical protein